MSHWLNDSDAIIFYIATKRWIKEIIEFFWEVCVRTLGIISED